MHPRSLVAILHTPWGVGDEVCVCLCSITAVLDPSWTHEPRSRQTKVRGGASYIPAGPAQRHLMHPLLCMLTFIFHLFLTPVYSFWFMSWAPSRGHGRQEEKKRPTQEAFFFVFLHTSSSAAAVLALFFYYATRVLPSLSVVEFFKSTFYRTLFRVRKLPELEAPGVPKYREKEKEKEGLPQVLLLLLLLCFAQKHR